MTVQRIVPNVPVAEPRAGDGFYRGFLGLEPAFDLGWIVSYRSPWHPAVQVSLVSSDATAPVDSALSVGVLDVDQLHVEALRRGYEIVHPLTDEPWGVRRFFVRDPQGTVVNLVAHLH
ncbi:MAG: glyoxalase [Actinomycetota bacterium]|nr:glyoxalase [Actinomycetota bacterium]